MRRPARTTQGRMEERLCSGLHHGSVSRWQLARLRAVGSLPCGVAPPGMQILARLDSLRGCRRPAGQQRRAGSQGKEELAGCSGRPALAETKEDVYFCLFVCMANPIGRVVSDQVHFYDEIGRAMCEGGGRSPMEARQR